MRGSTNGFQILTCAKCATLYTDHFPSAEASADYDAYYSETNLDVPPFVYRRLAEIFSDFGRYRETNQWLDVGFGAGATLETASQLGWHAHGVEVSSPAVAQARRRGFEVVHGTLAAAAYPAASFDVVTASEILEHVSDPDAVLREVARVLRPGGLFWGTTPSAVGLSQRLLGVEWTVVSPPEHIQLFSPQGIAAALRRAGFTRIKVKTHGLNPVEILNHFRRTPAASDRATRVSSSYKLNAAFEASSATRQLKRILNGALNLTRMGDSLKIHAWKQPHHTSQP